MIVKGGLCTTGCDERELQSLCRSVQLESAYYLRAAGNMGGGVIVVVKCRGEEAGNLNTDDDALPVPLAKKRPALLLIAL
jgi:hypothetical protein